MIRTDLSNTFRPVHDVCPVCRALAVQGRQQAEIDRREVPNDAPPERARPADGRTVRLRWESPDGVSATTTSARTRPPSESE